MTTNSLLTASMAASSPATDADWLRSLAWDRKAPATLVAAAAAGDPVRFGRAWRSRLRELRRGAAPVKALSTGWSNLPADEPFAKLLAATQPAVKQTRSGRAAIKPPASFATRLQPLVKWLVAESAAFGQPLVRLAALEILATTSASLPQRWWWPLFRQTVTAIQSAAPVDPQSLRLDQRLVLEGELPWLAGLVFADLAGMAAERNRGQKALRKELAARTDSDGTPHAEITPILPLWIAPLIRCTQAAAAFDAQLWSVDDAQLVSDVCERATGMSRGDGRLALTNGLAVDPLPVLSAAAIQFEWTPANPAWICLRGLQQGAKGKTTRKTRTEGALVMPSTQSDWSRLAVLRSDWTTSADSVAIAHHQPIPQLDVTLGGLPYLHGAWDLQVSLDGSPVELAEEWSCACFETDPDADYVELQMIGPGKLRVERMLLLSRTERFLLIVDSISGVRQRSIDYSARLPLAPEVTAEADRLTREWSLTCQKRKARLFPLAQPQQKVDSTPHRVALEGDGLRFEQQVQGNGLLSPVVIDWHPDRKTKPAEWRRLTVSEDGHSVGADIAGGFRWRAGASQWLLYRSLKRPVTPRAVLGHHTNNETVIARFDAQGDVDPLLLIEADE
jgi:hypothetical protein